MLERVWRKGNPPVLLLEMKVDAAAMENSMEVPQKTRNRITTWSSNPTPGHIYRENHYSKRYMHPNIQFSLVTQSCLTLCDPWTAAHQASLSITNSQSLLKLMSIKSVMPSNHFILYCPLLLLPSLFPSIRVFFNELVLRIRWPEYWSFSISPSSEYSELISFRID